MENKELEQEHIIKNSHRSFSKLDNEEILENLNLSTRTNRAQQAVLKAQQIVVKNNEMINELKKRNNIIPPGEYLN